MHQIGSPFGRVFGLKAILSFSVSTLVLTKYAILNLEPPLVLDFDENFYRTEGTATDLVSAATHARSSNATMVDADGVLKWAPHNIFPTSIDAGSTYGDFGGAVITDNVVRKNPRGETTGVSSVTSSDGTTARQGLQAATYLNLNADYTYAIWVNPESAQWVRLLTRNESSETQVTYFDLVNGVIGDSGHNDARITLADNGYYLIEVDYNAGATDATTALLNLEPADSDATSTYTGDGTIAFYLWGAHAYRSDLGGMVNNPTQPVGFETYVPTTSAAVYLPRVGHHIWNGSAWVDAGYFHESESRVQLLHTTNALVTQSYTVTAVPHTLHFTGTGTVTLSGASTAGPLVGTGTGEQNRVSLTFTPTAASLTLTVTGTVTDAQLEVGSTPSSYIPNLAGSGTVTRAADVMTIPAANLPWPEPEVIGPELVTNGTFDSDISGWTANNDAGGAVTWNAGGWMDVVYTSGIARAKQELALVAGRQYRVTFDVVATAPASCGCFLGTVKVSTLDAATAQTVTVYVTPTGDNFLSFRAFSVGTLSIDNISVREINPLAVSIQMSGTMTYSDDGIGAQVIYNLWQKDGNNFIRQSLVTIGGATGNPQFIQRALGVNDSLLAASTYSPGVNVPFNIASRHGSTFLNGAVDGTALTADLTPTALPDLETTDMQVAPRFNGTIKLFRVWADDLTDAGIEEASTNV